MSAALAVSTAVSLDPATHAQCVRQPELQFPHPFAEDYTGLAKKFVWGFPYDVTDKSEQKVLANTVFKIISDGLSEFKSGYLRSLP